MKSGQRVSAIVIAATRCRCIRYRAYVRQALMLSTPFTPFGKKPPLVAAELVR